MEDDCEDGLGKNDHPAKYSYVEVTLMKEIGLETYDVVMLDEDCIVDESCSFPITKYLERVQDQIVIVCET
ncbi:hypothetical protein V6N12_060977 [Hibiscus sabdariffa]|uniref:Uncharacterized protein n=1 Tax=Hibiscus sabdariffa TaxID=183260 RepID=A0ABR2DVV5_9ROSI